MSFIKKEDLIDDIWQEMLPYDIKLRIIEIISKQLDYTIGKGDGK